MILTLAVLTFLNIYSSGTSQQLFYQSKETSMVEKCLVASAEIEALEVINYSSVSNVVKQLGSFSMTRLIITDQFGAVIYDSLSEGEEEGPKRYALLPEIVAAMEKMDIFSWRYHDGAMHSGAATPIVSNGTLLGCVYMMEYDAEQGRLVKNLQQNIFSITLVLEVLIILYSLVFSKFFSNRLRRILKSIRKIQGGDYSQKIVMRGRDELVYLADEFNEMTEKLQSSEERRRQFVSDASHELKTPLASIKLLSDSILQNDMDMETVREFVGDIGKEADRLNRMSQKLLSLSKVESQEDVEKEIVFVEPTLKRVERMLSGLAKKNHIQMIRQVESDSRILIQEDDLYQIVFNLVENGIKYNTVGGSLTIALRREDMDAVLRVQDTGVGIPKESLGQIFERFYRVDKARSRKSGGSGLGLSIVRSLVERNGGTIGVESTVGVGTTFVVRFPIFESEEETT